MMFSRKKILASLFFIISLGIIAWFIFYEFTVRRLEQELENTISTLSKRGFTISYSSIEVTGTPFSFRGVLHDPYIKDPEGMFEWKGQAFEIQVQPWNYTTLTCSFPGDQKVTLPPNIPLPLSPLNFEKAEGVVKLSSGGNIKELTFTAQQVVSMSGGKSHPLSFEKFSLNLSNLLHPLATQISFTTNIKGIDTLLKISPIDRPILFIMKAHFSGYKNPSVFPKTLAEWRDGGGVLDITNLEIAWEPIAIVTEGSLTLDKDMYPLGSFTAEITGYQETLDYLVKSGLVKKKKAKAASFVLNLLTSPEEYGGKRLTVPITLQNKVLSIGPAPLFKLKPVSPVL